MSVSVRGNSLFAGWVDIGTLRYLFTLLKIVFQLFDFYYIYLKKYVIPEIANLTKDIKKLYRGTCAKLLVVGA